MDEQPAVFQDMDTAALLEIWGQNDRKRYTDEEFETIRLVLVQRLGSAPPLKNPPPTALGGLRPLAPGETPGGAKTSAESTPPSRASRLLRSYLRTVVLLTLFSGLLVFSLLLGLELAIYLLGKILGTFTVITDALWLLVLGTVAILPLVLGVVLLARRLTAAHREILRRLEAGEEA